MWILVDIQIGNIASEILLVEYGYIDSTAVYSIHTYIYICISPKFPSTISGIYP